MRHKRRRKVSSRLFGGSIEFTLILTSLVVVASAWLLGGVNDIVYAGSAAVALICLLFIAFDNWKVPSHASLWSSRIPWLFLLPFVLGGLQMIPVSDGLQKTLSPRAHQIRALLTKDNHSDRLNRVETDAPRTETKRSAVSLAPSATRYELARYWVVYAFLLIGMFGLSTERRRRFFFGLVVANGSLIAFFALIQRLSWNGKIFWVIQAPRHIALGPFVNKNNGAGYLLLVLAVAMAGVSRQATKASLDRELDRLGFAERLRLRFGAFINDNGLILRYLTLTILWLGILISMSRGAFAGAVAATFVTLLTIWRRRLWGTMSILVVSIAFAWALISWSQQTTGVSDRISTMTDSASALESSRFLHWGDDLRLANDFLTTGTGLGAYQFVNRPYKSFFIDATHLYSENQYLESLIVGGVVGLGLLFAFLAVTWNSVRDLAKNTSLRSKHIAALGTFALASQMVAGFFDFALYNAANGILMATLIGIVLGCGAQIAGPNRTTSSYQSRMTLGYRSWVIISLALGVFSVVELGLRSNVERAMHWSRRKIHVQNAGPDLSRINLDEEIDELENALTWYPQHPFGHARLANLRTMRFRLGLFDELKSYSGKNLDAAAVWAYTDPFVVSSKLRGNSEASSEEITQHPLYAAHLVPAWNSLLRARDAAPMNPQVHYLMALLEPLVNPDQVDAKRHVERLAFLAPLDPSLLFNSGMVIAQAGDREQGLEWIRKAASLEQEVPAHVANFARAYLSPSEFVNFVLPADPQVILQVVGNYFNEGEDDDWRVALGTRAAELLQAKSEETVSSTDLYELGLAHFYRGKAAEACEYFALAIKREPGVSPWRLAYARSLASKGDTSGALREAKLSFRLNPKNWRARKFMTSLERELRSQANSK